MHSALHAIKKKIAVPIQLIWKRYLKGGKWHFF